VMATCFSHERIPVKFALNWLFLYGLTKLYSHLFVWVWVRIWATPAVESASLQSKLFNFLECALIKVAHSNLEPLTLL
jgi:hypothetical protein